MLHKDVFLKKFPLAAFSCVLLLMIGNGTNTVQAQSANGTATPEKFGVTLYEFSLCQTSSCQNKMVLVNSAQDFDLATVSSGQSAGTFGGGNITIVAGTYNYAYMVWGRNLGLRGRVPFSLNGYTRDCISVAGAGLSDYGGSIGSIVTTDAGTPGNATQYISSGPGEGDTGDVTFLNSTQVATLISLSNPVTISSSNSGVLPAMQVSFNVSDTLRVFIDPSGGGSPSNWVCEIGLEPPVITFQIGSQSTTINIDTGS
jgi:hypothetical protein